MARNSEKAMTKLARWLAAKDGKNLNPERRPYLATECDSLPKSEKWRRQIIGEISRKVAQIQNAGLGEFRLRDLNDEINKLLREKSHWEDQIIELGGPDYRKIGPKMLDHEGKEVPGNRGYKYFGAAKELPGVKELFEHAPPPQQRKTRAELMKDIDADYYGYRDEDDGVLVPLEQQHEKQVVVAKVAEWKAKKEATISGDVTKAEENPPEEEDLYPAEEEEAKSEDGAISESDEDMETDEKGEHFIAHVPVPSQKEIEAALLERRKKELLEKYASDSLQAETDESKQMLGL